MANLKQRVKRLEKGKRRGLALLCVEFGETEEEAKRKYLAENPGREEDHNWLILLATGPPADPVSWEDRVSQEDHHKTSITK